VDGQALRPARPRPEPEPEISEEQQLELVERLAVKFLQKVVVEREARLSGEIVAADFYLRQITVIETAFDLTSEHFGFDANHVLRDLRRGGRGLMEIVDTPFAQYLDLKRREYWASTPGEPMRPIAFREEYLQDHGDHRTAVSHAATGAHTPPARGYSAEQWAEMTGEEQREARQRMFDEDAEEQVAWERRAVAEHNEQARSAT